MTSTAGPMRLGDVRRFPEDIQHDQSTYTGRFHFFLSMTDPRTLLTTPAQLAASRALIMKVERQERGWESVPVPEYLNAEKRVRAILHPDTHQPIPLPFRFSAYVPMNFINLCGMLALSQQTPARAMFWQFSNQTYNVGFNYCNGSGKDGLSVRSLLLSYTMATCTACGLSYFLSMVAANHNGGGPRVSFNHRFWHLLIPYTAVAGANLANVGVIRFRDLITGIPVSDAETGEVLCNGAPSPAAGRLAVTQVALSRVLIPIPLMVVPPLFLNFLFDPLKGVGFFKRHRAQLYLPVNVLTLVAVLEVALPLCIAIFPQRMVVPCTWLERPFQGQVNAEGNCIAQVTFNKGL